MKFDYEEVNETVLYDHMQDNPYLLLTPGPLSTTKSVKASMLFDLCTWDEDYKKLTQIIRKKLVKLASKNEGKYTSVLMQGSGTFCMESVIGSTIAENEKLLVLANGAYGSRIAEITRTLSINLSVKDSSEVSLPDLLRLEQTLKHETDITHVAVVHCETTTGILNPVKEIGRIVKEHDKTFIVDAMSSFGGIELDMDEYNIDFLVSSANKCIQGVPGFGFIIAKTDKLKKCKGLARSLSLDLYDQWEVMNKNGKWRFTSPTHSVRAFSQALIELEVEGGIKARYKRYKSNQESLVEGMSEIPFKTLIPRQIQSPIITSFYYPESKKFSFKKFYQELKKNGFVIYPGKISQSETFRIGTIGNITVRDILSFIDTVKEIKFW
jgi:2-aminoethylphosphonate-pyruvate transaminase